MCVPERSTISLVAPFMWKLMLIIHCKAGIKSSDVQILLLTNISDFTKGVHEAYNGGDSCIGCENIYEVLCISVIALSPCEGNLFFIQIFTERVEKETKHQKRSFLFLGVVNLLENY